MAVSNLTMASAIAIGGPAPGTRDLAALCPELGCDAPSAVQCAYVDSRGRSCPTRWCHRHLHRVGAAGYCRRHASTVAALGGKSADPRALPAVDHRGASLVSWICTEGRPALHQAVVSGLGRGEVAFEDRTVNVVRLEDGRRRWEQGWRIGDSGGVIRRVLLFVDESDDALVSLEVYGTVVAVAVPPWVTRRRAGQLVSPEVDAEDRAQFYGFLIGAIRQGLAAQG
jgi:hypothetical protein